MPLEKTVREQCQGWIGNQKGRPSCNWAYQNLSVPNSETEREQYEVSENWRREEAQDIITKGYMGCAVRTPLSCGFKES